MTPKRSIIKIFLIIIFSVIENFIGSFKCSVPNIDINYAHVLHGNKSTGQKFRIFRLYDRSFQKIPNFDKVRTFVIEPAISYWENALKPVKPIRDKILLSRACKNKAFNDIRIEGKSMKMCINKCEDETYCLSYKIPNHYLDQCYYIDNGVIRGDGQIGSGASNADMILFIAANQENCEYENVAKSTFCQLSKENDAPVAGLLMLCESKMFLGVNTVKSISIVNHKIAHILGFNVNLYAFFRDARGLPLTDRDSKGLPMQKFDGSFDKIHLPSENTLIKQRQIIMLYNFAENQKEVYYLVTPNIKRLTRKFFRCNTIHGGAIEDDGSFESKMSHFEKRIYMDELMTGSINVKGFLSQFTLAVLQDTGWYTVNYNLAENLDIENSLGCELFFTSCYSTFANQVNNDYRPYCVSLNNEFSCSTDRLYVKSCKMMLSTSSTLPDKYRFFQNRSLITKNYLADFCPIYGIMHLQELYDFNGLCTDLNNNYIKDTLQNVLLQEYGSSSRCIDAPKDKLWEKLYKNTLTKDVNIYGAGCYKTICIKPNKLIIVVTNKEFVCEIPGHLIYISILREGFNFRGKLICPHYQEVCNSKWNTSYYPKVDSDCSGDDCFTAKPQKHSQTTYPNLWISIIITIISVMKNIKSKL